MQTKSYTTIDRSWPSGPWDGEPDKMQWPDAETGLPCLAVRHQHSGHWCGYVGVSESHPLHGKNYSDDDLNLDVHGGLTFSDICQPVDDESRGICHVPDANEPDHVWWFGFDCAHLGDATPLDAKYALEGGSVFSGPGDTYKTLNYVRAECAKLAKQLVEE